MGFMHHFQSGKELEHTLMRYVAHFDDVAAEGAGVGAVLPGAAGGGVVGEVGAEVVLGAEGGVAFLCGCW